MTNFRLKFWTKGDQERVYVEGIKGAPYFSRTFASGNGYYSGERELSLVINGDQTLGKAILAAAGVEIQHDFDGNPAFSFPDVAPLSKGGPPAWFGSIPVKDRKRLARERDDAVYTLDRTASCNSASLA